MKKNYIIFLSLVLCLCFVTGCPSDKPTKTTATIADDTLALPVITAEATESSESIKPSADTPTPTIISSATDSETAGTTAEKETQAPSMPSGTVKDATKETVKETTRETTTQPTASSSVKETVPPAPTPTPVPKATPTPAPTVTPTPVPTATPVPEPPAITGSYDTAMAQTVAEIVNTERTNAGVSVLTWDNTLAGYAQTRAAELAISFSHTRPDGSPWYTAGTGICGENIASGQISAEEVMSAWMNSTGHKENILKTQFTRIGVGCYQIDGAYYWVQLFG